MRCRARVQERQRRAIIRDMERGQLTCRELRNALDQGLYPAEAKEGDGGDHAEEDGEEEDDDDDDAVDEEDGDGEDGEPLGVEHLPLGGWWVVWQLGHLRSGGGEDGKVRTWLMSARWRGCWYTRPRRIGERSCGEPMQDACAWDEQRKGAEVHAHRHTLTRWPWGDEFVADNCFNSAFDCPQTC